MISLQDPPLSSTLKNGAEEILSDCTATNIEWGVWEALSVFKYMKCSVINYSEAVLFSSISTNLTKIVDHIGNVVIHFHVHNDVSYKYMLPRAEGRVYGRQGMYLKMGKW